MGWTGERLETFIINQSTIEHLHRYAFTFEYIKGKEVLDIASGEGYGSNLMAKYANSVTGVDISEKAIKEAQAKYIRDNLKYIVGDTCAIPLEDASIDVVVSFETIEHHTRHKEMMCEIKRVLRKDGILIISSPDKKQYSDQPGYQNPFHVKELYSYQFNELISHYFDNIILLSQNNFVGSLIVPEDKFSKFFYFEGSYSNVNQSLKFTPLYNIAIASNSNISDPFLTVFEGRDVLNKELVAEKTKVANDYKNSLRYKIGNTILYPLSYIKRLLLK